MGSRQAQIVVDEGLAHFPPVDASEFEDGEGQNALTLRHVPGVAVRARGHGREHAAEFQDRRQHPATARAAEDVAKIMRHLLAVIAKAGIGV